MYQKYKLVILKDAILLLHIVTVTGPTASNDTETVDLIEESQQSFSRFAYLYIL